MDDAIAWKAISSISEELADMVRQTSSPTVTTGMVSTEVPALNLRSGMLLACGQMDNNYLTSAQKADCVRILHDGLSELADAVEAAFQDAWRQAEGPDTIATQRALYSLFRDGYFKEAATRKQNLLSLIESSGKKGIAPENDGSAGWTDGTRSLMERIYQRHPKLAAHEKKLLAEVSGLSLRQISIWFANQRQRRGWPAQHEESIDGDVEEEPEDTSLIRSKVSHLSSSTFSSIGHCPSPFTPSSINSACPSLSSSTSSRTSSDSESWTSTFSPTLAPFQFGASISRNQAPVFKFSQPVPPPQFDIDQLIRQLTPPQVATPETLHNEVTLYTPTPPNEATKGPFAFKFEEEEATPRVQTMPHSSAEPFAWLPINMQGLLSQADATLPANGTIEDFTPQASQLAFAPLQLDTSQYLRQSPSANVDLSNVIDSFNTNDFWNTFAISNNIPSMPSSDSSADSKRRKGNDGVAIAHVDTSWSDAFLQDLDTWGNPPQLAQPQLQL